MAHSVQDVPSLVKPGPQETHEDVEAFGAEPLAHESAEEDDETHALPDAVVPEGQAETHTSAPAALYLPVSQAEHVSTVLAVPPIPR